MRHLLIKNSLLISFCLLLSGSIFGQHSADLEFDFNRNLKSGNHQFIGAGSTFVEGVEGQALSLVSDNGYSNLQLMDLSLDGTQDFSIQCWIKTTSENPTVLLSQKNFDNKGIVTQKNAGWALYSSGGTFAWSIGSGERRINYERDNGEKMPINDGEWHQITMTYSQELSEFRLYYDGLNKATYKVNFDFVNTEPLMIGSIDRAFDYENRYSPDIESGQEQLQAFVDEFNALGLAPVQDEEFIDLIVDPEKLFNTKQEGLAESKKTSKDQLSRALDIRRALASNPYTVYQIRELTELKPVSKIYTLQAGKIVIDKTAGKFFTQEEQLFPSDFAIDQLSIWKQAISEEEVLNSYTRYQKTKPYKLRKKLKKLTVGVWNIWHGGIHWTKEKDGWDSRLRIVEMIKEQNIDVILMQETYSSGDFIAAELGYYFATTSDWDYRYQGANISVISRYPIKELLVSEETEFNNVAVKLAISKSQEIWAMSNWYGMAQFPAVFDFHKSRFANSENIPVLFGGDFNAVPHTDGGDSPASKKMIEEGFTDAFRSVHPAVEKYPGFTHRSRVRIDQLYFQGKGLKHQTTEVISSWPTGFPSDHFLIMSKFKLDY